MTYAKQSWENAPARSTPLSAARLNHMEDGIAAADAVALSAVPSSRKIAGIPLSSDVSLVKADVGLGNVDNTADSAKPVSAATATALAGKADLVAGRLNPAQLPDLAIADFLGEVANQAAMLALAGQRGDWCARTDSGTNWILIADTPGSLSSWRQLSYPVSPVSSVAGRTGAVVLTKADVGLSSVDNTSDAEKPISTATAAALAGKADSASLATVATSGSYGDLSDKPVIPAPLPDQSGQAGKVLTTDGSSVSWETPGASIELVSAPPVDGTPGVLYADTVNGKFYKWEA